MADVKINQAELGRLLTGSEGPVYRDLNRRLNLIRNEARRLAPVDRGILRGSIEQEIRVTGSSIVGRVGTNVEYAIHQEFGTRFMAARPFLRPALSAGLR